jgi:excisionase family DNA binding protein
MSELLTMREVQKRLKVGRTTLRYLIDQDRDFRTVKLGHRRLMSVDALDRFVKAKEAADPKAVFDKR